MSALCCTNLSRTDWEANGSPPHLSNTSEKHPQNTEQTIKTKIFETPAEPNTYDNLLGLQDLPRSKSDAHIRGGEVYDLALRQQATAAIVVSLGPHSRVIQPRILIWWIWQIPLIGNRHAYLRTDGTHIPIGRPWVGASTVPRWTV